MTSKVHQGLSDYDSVDDRYSRYQHLQRDGRHHTDSTGRTRRNIESERSRPKGGSDNHTCCKRPPWWAWFLVLLSLVIIGGLAAVLFFVLQSCPKGDASPNPSTGILRGANCQALYTAGYTTSGVQTISPYGVKQMMVYCEQALDGGGWTVFQRRYNGQVDFNRRWSEYRNGFGDVMDEHWLGNDNIHILTSGGNQKLKIEMTHPDGTLAYADYNVFWIENEANNYKLHISGFIDSNPPGDALSSHNGFAFTTSDRDNDMNPDGNCAQYHPGGWWFTECHPSHLNGVYSGIEWNGIIWYPWTSGNQSLVNVRMMAKTHESL